MTGLRKSINNIIIKKLIANSKDEKRKTIIDAIFNEEIIKNFNLFLSKLISQFKKMSKEMPIDSILKLQKS